MNVARKDRIMRIAHAWMHRKVKCVCFLAAGAREQVLRLHFRLAYAANDTRERFHAPSWRIVTCGRQQCIRQQAANVSEHISEDLLEWTREFRDTSRLEEQKKKNLRYPDMFSDEYTVNRKGYFFKINYRIR